MADDSNAKSKYAYLAAPSPVFESLKDDATKLVENLYAIKDIENFKAAWNSFPPALFDDGPAVGKDITIEHINIPVRDGTVVELRIYKPIDPAPDAPLFFVSHGGGWVMFTHDAEEAQNRQVAKDTRCVVVSVEYRKCPEFPFPYPLNDCFDALIWCKSNASTLGINPEKVFLAGATSGANLVVTAGGKAASLALKARDEGVTGILGQVLNMPMICHPDFFPRDKYEYKSWDENKEEAVASSTRALFHWNLYLPEGKPEVYANPILAESHANLPPACKKKKKKKNRNMPASYTPQHKKCAENYKLTSSLVIQIAGFDPLRDEGFAYGEALKAAGVPVTEKAFAGLPHAFYFFLKALDKESREYFQNIVNFIQEIEKK
ncbi:hypothetical protein ACJ72_00223 [Emergomyces africanus]|uniref:Alpha/beta hydrolase fold-3 domain-containing protein n=1 Tax=Emergomyces africanus TaxID=1955775 RepID=A0A1B7P8Q0_9EURO|nr:hypothetical protein ACJ72_00223 [Emergomyces africanus]